MLLTCVLSSISEIWVFSSDPYEGPMANAMVLRRQVAVDIFTVHCCVWWGDWALGLKAKEPNKANIGISSMLQKLGFLG